MLDTNHSVTPVAQGLPASPGGASGAVAFDADRAERFDGFRILTGSDPICAESDP